MSRYSGKLSSDQTLKRIQEETQRVRRRLTEEDLVPERGTMTSPSRQAAVDDVPSVEVSSCGSPFEQAGNATPTSTYIIENSESLTFKDPVPARNRSAHLRTEHEAFKQR